MKHKIKTFADACKATKTDPKALPIVTNMPKKHQKAIVANYKLFVIVEALNEGWTPDWENRDEYKYYPWFNMPSKKNKSGFGFSSANSVYSSSYTDVGSRLCFKSRELSDYAGRQFEKLFKDVMVK